MSPRSRYVVPGEFERIVFLDDALLGTQISYLSNEEPGLYRLRVADFQAEDVVVDLDRIDRPRGRIVRSARLMSGLFIGSLVDGYVEERRLVEGYGAVLHDGDIIPTVTRILDVSIPPKVNVIKDLQKLDLTKRS